MPSIKNEFAAEARQWLLIAAVATFAVFIFQFDSLRADYATMAGGYSDFQGIATGYSLAMEQGPRWWTGGWINANQVYYRPLASHMHFIQQWASYQGLFQWVTVGSMLMFSLICALVGVVTQQLTRCLPVTLAATVGLAASGEVLSGVDRWLGCWMLMDNALVVTFCLMAVITCLEYLKSPRIGLLLSLWACVLLAVFSKEQGILLAPSLAVLVAILPRNQHSKAVLARVAIMALASALLYKFGRGMLPFAAPLTPLGFLGKVWNDFQTQPTAEFFLVSNTWIAGLVQLGILALVPVLVWTVPALREWLERYRLAPVLALFLCARLAVLPAEIHGVSNLSMRFLVVWMWWAPLAATAGFAVYGELASRVRMRRREQTVPLSPQPTAEFS